MNRRNRIALIFALLISGALGMSLLIPVSAAPAPTFQVHSAPVAEVQTAHIQFEYVAPPAALQVPDSTAEPNLEPTAEATTSPGGDVIIVNPPEKKDETSTNLLNLLYGVAIAVLGGGGLIYVFDRIRGNKAVLDAAEGIYEDKVTPEMQATIRDAFLHIRELSNRAFDVLDKITDGLPNVVDEGTSQAIKQAKEYKPPEYPKS